LNKRVVRGWSVDPASTKFWDIWRQRNYMTILRHLWSLFLQLSLNPNFLTISANRVRLFGVFPCSKHDATFIVSSIHTGRPRIQSPCHIPTWYGQSASEYRRRDRNPRGARSDEAPLDIRSIATWHYPLCRSERYGDFIAELCCRAYHSCNRSSLPFVLDFD
jgi:hypothetical protein